jgi:zinc protease
MALTYYIKKNAKPEKKVDLRLVVNAGSILKPTTNKDWRILWSTCFNGTKRFPKKPIGRLFTKYWC